MPVPWDYLILTASNAPQAAAYADQLRLRREQGLLKRVRETMVVADIGGQRIGSGGSTLHCLALALNRELDAREVTQPGWDEVEEILRGLRILIVHAGGDSRRLPAYAPCGKIFVPVPGETPSALPLALFDILAPPFLDLPPAGEGRGQTIVCSGDALIRFDPAALRFDKPGITMVGGYASVEEAAKHGVYCMSRSGALRLYLQKPGAERQREAGAVTPQGTVLDAGVMSMDASAATALLRAFHAGPDDAGRLGFSEAMRETVLARGLDLYREICCAMGSEATVAHYLRTACESGSRWDEARLAALFPALNAIPTHVHVLPNCNFLHFGSTRQLISSGLALAGCRETILSLNNRVAPPASLSGSESWVEGCRVNAAVSLAGWNALVGVNVDEPLTLPRGACLEMAAGKGRWFVRCYGIGDTFKDQTFCGIPMQEWLAAAGVEARDVWSDDTGEPRSLWNARVFPAVRDHAAYRRWLWMFAPARATAGERAAFLAAERHSAAEIVLLADQRAFHRRRLEIRAEQD